MITGSIRPGYPNYEEIQNERERRKQQEIEGGRQRVLKDMATGLVDRISGELKTSCFLICDDPDPKVWTVICDIKPDVRHEESFWVFPSDELKTILMLIRG